MSVELVMECMGCGLFFKQDFNDMAHGRVLKCPFCFSTGLDLQGEVASDDNPSSQGRELAINEQFINYKVKI